MKPKSKAVQEPEIRAVSQLFELDTNLYTDKVESISTVYACIRLISNTISSTVLKFINNNKDIIDKSPLDRLLTRETLYSFLNNMSSDLITHGNSYALVLPTEVIYIPQNQVQVYQTNVQAEPMYYRLTAFGKSYDVWPENIIHFKNMTWDGIVGISPMTLHASTFNAALAQADYNKNFVDNSSQISGVITTEKKLKKETVQALSEQFSKKYAGTSNAGKTPVLSEGMDFKQIQRLSPLDMDYINTANLTKSNICEIFGVPESMLGTSDLSYNNSESNALMFSNYLINPILTNLEMELTYKLSNSTNTFQFQPDSIRNASTKERADSLSLLVNTSIITPNEARRYYNLPSVEGGDELQKETQAKAESEQAAAKEAKQINETNTPPNEVKPASKRKATK